MASYVLCNLVRNYCEKSRLDDKFSDEGDTVYHSAGDTANSVVKT